MFNFSRYKSILAFLMFTVSTLTYAQSSAKSTEPEDWKFSLGAAVTSSPQYPGSKKNDAMVLPNFEIRYRDYLFIDPINGFGIEQKITDGLTGRLSIGYDFTNRRAKDDVRFTGLVDIKPAGALRAGLQYRAGSYFAKGTVTDRLGKEQGRGTMLDLEAGYSLFASPIAGLDLGAIVQTMDNTYAKNFFGITQTQSSVTGLKVFEAKSGVLSSGVFVQGYYKLTPNWTAFARLEALQLGGDAKDSPITQKKAQTSLLATVNYTF